MESLCELGDVRCQASLPASRPLAVGHATVSASSCTSRLLHLIPTPCVLARLHKTAAGATDCVAEGKQGCTRRQLSLAVFRLQ